MSQRRLLVGALALTLALGGALFVYQQVGVDAAAKVDIERCKNNAKYYRNNKKKCKNAIANETPPSPTPTPSATAPVTPGATPTVSASPAEPSPDPVPSGSPIAIIQAPNNQKNFPKVIQTPPGLDEGILRLDLLKKANKEASGAYRKAFDNDAVTKSTTVRFDSVWKADRLMAPLYPAQSGPFIGHNNGGINRAYAISHGFTTGESNSTDWQTFIIRYKARNANKMTLHYRVSDTVTEDPKADDWQEIELSYGTNWKTLRREIDETGKYFQYKLQMDGTATRADTIGIIAQPLSSDPDDDPDPVTTPDPNATATPTPAPTGTPVETGEGTFSISTVYLAGIDGGSTSTPSPSPSSNVLLPSVSPASSPTPSAPSDYTELCFDDRQVIEDAANVSLSIVQKTNIPPGKKPIKLEDQRTDADGVWQGIAEQKKFPVGTYEVKFGEFRREDFKLVAFCDPSTGALIKTQSDPLTRKATVRVRADQETELIALYAPRNKPYISMKKYAVPTVVAAGASRRVLSVVYPGISFTYLVQYTNTGDGAAKNLVIRDVIPAQYEVDESILESEEGGFQMEPDLRGGTLVTKTVGDLPVGGTGWVSIPVTLKADAFTGQNNPDSLLGDF